MTPASLDPASVRLSRKLHELVEAIDAAEHAATLLNPGVIRGRALADFYEIRALVQWTQRELEHAAAGT